MTRTCDCGEPIPDQSRRGICAKCHDTAVEDVLALPDLVDDVNLTITRQTATGPRNGARSTTEDVIAWNDAASRTLARAVTRLLSWARVTVPVIETERDILIDRRDTIARATDQTDKKAVLAAQLEIGRCTTQIQQLTEQLDYLTSPRWVIAASHRRLTGLILDRIDALTFRSDASTFTADMHRTRAELTAATDTPAPRLYLGPCRADPLNKGAKCPEEVYAVDHSDQGKGHLCDKCRTVTCRTCGTEHDVEQRRAWLKEAMNDRLATAGDIARGLAGTTGVVVTKNQINWWVATNRLIRHGADKAGRALYRVGDVIDLADEETRRRAGSGA